MRLADDGLGRNDGVATGGIAFDHPDDLVFPVRGLSQWLDLGAGTCPPIDLVPAVVLPPVGTTSSQTGRSGPPPRRANQRAGRQQYRLPLGRRRTRRGSGRGRSTRRRRGRELLCCLRGWNSPAATLKALPSSVPPHPLTPPTSERCRVHPETNSRWPARKASGRDALRAPR